MDKKRKIELIASIVIVILLIGVAISIFCMVGNDKEKKASEIFGNDSCEVILHMATKDLAPHTCSICGKEFQDSSMRADICTECAQETNRCDFCGKKLLAK